MCLPPAAQSHKLMSLAELTWRGNENNKNALIDATFLSQTGAVDDYLRTNRREAKKRDHRKLARTGLFCCWMKDRAVPFFLPKGMV
jgi:threonyl-tRNA synthetase